MAPRVARPWHGAGYNADGVYISSDLAYGLVCVIGLGQESVCTMGLDVALL